MVFAQELADKQKGALGIEPRADGKQIPNRQLAAADVQMQGAGGQVVGLVHG